MSATAPSATPALTDEAQPPVWLFFSFRGRISRRTWWQWGVLAMLGVGLVIFALLSVAGLSHTKAEGVANVLLLWPTLAISAKRWHDRDKSAWWLLVNLIPLVGWLWALVENGLLAGTEGNNRYGPAPEPRQ